MNGKIHFNLVFGVLIVIAIVLGVTAYFVIFGAGTQVVQPETVAPPASSPWRRSYSPLPHHLLALAPGNAASSSTTALVGTFSSLSRLPIRSHGRKDNPRSPFRARRSTGTS